MVDVFSFNCYTISIPKILRKRKWAVVDYLNMSNKEIITSFNKFKDVCLRNSEDLLRASKVSLEAGVDHASFHLTLLALEEIGKMEMEIIQTMSLLHPKPEPIRYNLATDDHQRKLFFSFWGPSFGREKQTKTLLDNNHTLAKNLHESRLLYLYSDPENPQHWSELMGQDEAKKLYGLAEVRLKMAQSSGELDSENTFEPDDDLAWFFKAQEDEQKKKEIWGHKSQEKLLELKDVKSWIKWLKDIYQKNEEEMREIAEKELIRQEPPEDEKLDPKWRLSIEIMTPSHSIRQKNLKQFNDGVNWIKLKYKDTNTLGIEFTLTKNIPIQGLWWHGWGMARMFVVALNVATHGLFWWNSKRDARYYKEIWDLENNAGINLQPSEELERNWKEKRWVLREVDLSLVSIIFSYLGYCHINHKEKHLDHYVAGLSFLAKSDVHLRFEMNSFDEFFKSLKIAMIENGDWDEKSSFTDAYLKVNEWHKFSEMPPKIIEDMHKLFDLAFKVEVEHKGTVNLSAVYGMKEYCEIYFQTLTVRHIKQEKGQDVRIVFGTNEKEDNQKSSENSL